MNTAISKLKRMKVGNCDSYWSERIIAELEYAIQLTKFVDNVPDKSVDSQNTKIEKAKNNNDKTGKLGDKDKYNGIIKEAIDFLYNSFTEDGFITNNNAKKAEAKLKPLSKAAKKYKVLAVAHAHIDMNWMWSYDETTAIVLDTFRTMLDLMDEYPDFTFSQSQLTK